MAHRIRSRLPVAVALALGMLVRVPGIPAAELTGTAAGDMSERVERSLLARKDAPGVLVAVSAGTPGRGLGVTVHGINASARDVVPLTRELARSGAATSTFAYDDNYRRLEDSADDLARALDAQLDAQPSAPLRIWAHSMGARVTLAALARLADAGRLGGRDVELELVAPALSGYTSANLMRLGPTLLLRVKNARPSLDLGTSSRFQRQLESLSLPARVQTRVFLASNDRLVNCRHPRLRRVVACVRAEVVLLPGTTHESAVAAAAAWLHERSAARADGSRASTPAMAPGDAEVRTRQ